MLTETTTRTLPLDTYPVRIDPESITPGTVFFITESHSGIIGRISELRRDAEFIAGFPDAPFEDCPDIQDTS
jgi:hypothetical protein